MVVDSSVLLAVLFAEPYGRWAADRLAEHAPELRMSTVNLAEILIRIRDRRPQSYQKIEATLLSSGIRYIAPDVRQARIVAKARIDYPLNLGDCFAYALARTEGCPILTLDRDFRSLDWDVLSPQF